MHRCPTKRISYKVFDKTFVKKVGKIVKVKISIGLPGMFVQITTIVCTVCPHNAQKCVSHSLQHFLDNFFYLVWRSLEKETKIGIQKQIIEQDSMQGFFFVGGGGVLSEEHKYNGEDGHDLRSDFSVQSDALELLSESEGGSLDHDSDYSVLSDLLESDDSSANLDLGENDSDTSFANISVDGRFLEHLYDGAKLTVFESYSLLLQYSLRHGLTKRAFSDLLQLLVHTFPWGLWHHFIR